MDPRRLVGMTMGARKRAAHRDLLARAAKPHRPDEAAWFVQSLQFRATLRIGERLRPCPGCYHCKPEPDDSCMACGCDGADGTCGCDPEPCEGCERIVCGVCREDGLCPDCGGHTPSFVEQYGEIICDGSGVLPARTA